ncbi:MAG: hypothetical protein Fur0022_48050 [Anaerolineales bacterium]
MLYFLSTQISALKHVRIFPCGGKLSKPPYGLILLLVVLLLFEPHRAFAAAPEWQNPPPNTTEPPANNQLGWDFWTIWLTRRAAEPYSVVNAYYPPPMMLVLRVIGLLPGGIAYYAWTTINLLLLVYMLKRRALLYIFYMPTLFHLATGQLDIFLLWLSTFLKKQDWKTILAGVIITFKPQVAFILLPWHLLQWTWKTRLIWAASTISVWGYYFLVRPDWYTQWLSNTPGMVHHEASATPSLFSLFPFWISVLIALVLLVFVWFRLDEKSAIATGVFATPFGKTYDAVLLLRSEIVWWIIPLSWLGLFVSLYLNHPWPQAVVTGLVFVLALWQYHQKEGSLSKMAAVGKDHG